MNCQTRDPLDIDKALLNVSVSTNFSVQLLTQSAECDHCPLIVQNVISPGGDEAFIVNTTFATLFSILKTDSGSVVCEQIKYHFGEWGEYLLDVSFNATRGNNCVFRTIKEPVNSNLYNVWAFIFYVVLVLLWLLGTAVYRHVNKVSQEDERLLVSELGSPSEHSRSSHIWSFTVDVSVSRIRERLHSLDTFRGICIAVMIFVNYGGGKYWYFEHSKWNGLTVADIVFPWFLWIMGVSIALSLQSHLRRAVPRRKIFVKILRRSIVLFVLGLILNSKYELGCELDHMRILGVLQRFGLSYFVVATLQLLSEKPGDVYQFECWAPLRDIIPYWPQWIFFALALSAHVLITFLLPIPGCPTGYLGPGGLHLNASFPNCTGGAAGFIDRLVLGCNHLHQSPTFKNIYDTTLPFDPEGILGYLTSFLVVFFGLQAGKILTLFPLYTSRIQRWLFWGVITGTTGAIVCKLSINDGWVPVNKNLWSVSFVLITSSMAFVMLTLCYLLTDVFRFWSGAPFYHAGMNAILLYVGHMITERCFPWGFPVPNTHAFHLCVDLWGTSLWVMLSVWLYYCNFFLAI